MRPIRFGKASGRPRKTGKNLLEKEYGDYLEQRHRAGEVLWYDFESIKVRLADNTFYTPDYLVMLADGTLEAHECKGHWEDDARVKIKVAAERYPFRFIAITKAKKKDGGGWRFEQFSGGFEVG